MNQILRRILIGLAMLTGIPVFFIMAFFVWFMAYTYWTADSKFDRGGTGEPFAAFVALNPEIAKNAVRFSFGTCDLDNPSLSSHECTTLRGMKRGACRWWFGEHCEAYKLTDLFMKDHDKLGTLLHATIDPCSYFEEMKKARGSERWCTRKYENTEQIRPVVLVFMKDRQTESLRIRIDFPEGFTTAAEENIRNTMTE